MITKNSELFLPMFVPGTKPAGLFTNGDGAGVVVGRFDIDGTFCTGISCGGSSGPIGLAEVVPWGKILGKLLIDDSISLIPGRVPTCSWFSITLPISTPWDPKFTISTLKLINVINNYV